VTKKKEEAAVDLESVDLRKQQSEEQRKKERAIKMIQSLEEAQQTVLNGGVTNAEKMIEE